MSSMENTLEDTLRRYLEGIALWLRPNTVLNSRWSIADFIRYLHARHPEVSSFRELERAHIEGWLAYLAAQPLKRSTRRIKIIKLRLFLQRLVEWAWEDAPSSLPLRSGDLPADDVYLPRPLSDETDRALRDELLRRGGIVHKGILLLRATGLRIQEFLDLEVRSLRKLPSDDWELHVPLGKLHSERVLPVDGRTARLFMDLRELRGNPPPVAHPQSGRPTNLLLVRPSGKRYNGETFRYYLRKIEKEAALSEHVTPHRLRHTFATEMLRARMHLPVLMKLLGHRTIGMTLRYARITQDDVRREYYKAMQSVQQRYEIPPAPPSRSGTTEISGSKAIRAHLSAATSALECRRRDSTNPCEKKAIRRIVERIRRLAVDLTTLHP